MVYRFNGGMADAKSFVEGKKDYRIATLADILLLKAGALLAYQAEHPLLTEILVAGNTLRLQGLVVATDTNVIEGLAPYVSPFRALLTEADIPTHAFLTALEASSAAQRYTTSLQLFRQMSGEPISAEIPLFAIPATIGAFGPSGNWQITPVALRGSPDALAAEIWPRLTSEDPATALAVPIGANLFTDEVPISTPIPPIRELIVRHHQFIGELSLPDKGKRLFYLAQYNDQLFVVDQNTGEVERTCLHVKPPGIAMTDKEASSHPFGTPHGYLRAGDGSGTVYEIQVSNYRIPRVSTARRTLWKTLLKLEGF